MLFGDEATDTATGRATGRATAVEVATSQVVTECEQMAAEDQGHVTAMGLNQSESESESVRGKSNATATSEVKSKSESAQERHHYDVAAQASNVSAQVSDRGERDALYADRNASSLPLAQQNDPGADLSSKKIVRRDYGAAEVLEEESNDTSKDLSHGEVLRRDDYDGRGASVREQARQSVGINAHAGAERGGSTLLYHKTESESESNITTGQNSEVCVKRADAGEFEDLGHWIHAQREFARPPNWQG